jgi:hypothetical protein
VQELFNDDSLTVMVPLLSPGQPEWALVEWQNRHAEN